MAKKEIHISINPDGTVELDQQGWDGKDCDGAIDDLIKSLGKEITNKKKKEWYRKAKIQQKQKWKD